MRTRAQLFALGYRTPTFHDEKVKNLLSFGVNRGDLRILNYIKTVFGRGSAPVPSGRAHEFELSQIPESDGKSPLEFISRLGTKGHLVLLN